MSRPSVSSLCQASLTDNGVFLSTGRSDILGCPDLAVQLMLRRDLLGVPPPSPTHAIRLRNLLQKTLLDAQTTTSGSDRPTTADRLPSLPLNVKTLRLFLGTSPNDPVICALTLLGLHSLGPTAADEFEAVERLVINRSPWSEAATLVNDEPFKGWVNHQGWMVEALDSVRPFTRPEVVARWKNVCRKDDVFVHRERLLSLYQHFSIEPLSIDPVVAYPTTFALPAVPTAFLLLDSYAQASLSVDPTDPLLNLFTLGIWSTARSGEGAEERIERKRRNLASLSAGWERACARKGWASGRHVAAGRKLLRRLEKTLGEDVKWWQVGGLEGWQGEGARVVDVARDVPSGPLEGGKDASAINREKGLKIDPFSPKEETTTPSSLSTEGRTLSDNPVIQPAQREKTEGDADGRVDAQEEQRLQTCTV